MAQQLMVERSTAPTTLASWRLTGIGLLWIVFGIVWAVDTGFKWQPDFINNFMDWLTDEPVVSRDAGGA